MPNKVGEELSDYMPGSAGIGVLSSLPSISWTSIRGLQEPQKKRSLQIKGLRIKAAVEKRLGRSSAPVQQRSNENKQQH